MRARSSANPDEQHQQQHSIDPAIHRYNSLIVLDERRKIFLSFCLPFLSLVFLWGLALITENKSGLTRTTSNAHRRKEKRTEVRLTCIAKKKSRTRSVSVSINTCSGPKCLKDFQSSALSKDRVQSPTGNTRAAAVSEPNYELLQREPEDGKSELCINVCKKEHLSNHALWTIAAVRVKANRSSSCTAGARRGRSQAFIVPQPTARGGELFPFLCRPYLR